MAVSLKFGFQHPSFSFDGKTNEISDSLRRLVVKVEASGFDSFWLMDHFHQIRFVGDPEEPMLEGWTTLAALSGATSKIKLGTLVTGNTYRYPSIIAKIGATLDVMTNGRLFLGIGAGWNEEEATAYGIQFPQTRERILRLEEAVQIIKKMWTEDQASFDGRYYKLRGAYCNPKPIQKPHPPIMVGGSGERETLRIVAKYADACNLFGSVQTVQHKLGVLKEHCNSVGRNYDQIRKTMLTRIAIGSSRSQVEKQFAAIAPEQIKEMVTYGTPEDVRRQVEKFRDAGIDYLIVNCGRESDTLGLFISEVVRQLSD